MLSFLLIIINSGCIKYYVGYFVLGLFVLLYFQALTQGKISITFINKSPLWLLAVSGLLYAIACNFSTDRNWITSIVIYCLLPAFVFVSGYIVTNNKNGVLFAEKALCAIAIGCVIHITLNIYANMSVARRDTTDFFMGLLAATNLATVNTFIFALLPCLVITRKKNVKFVGFIIFSLAMVYTFILGTRTPLYALVIMSAISAFIYVNRLNSKGRKEYVIIKWCLIATAIIGVFCLIYLTNFANIRSKIDMSTLIRRYSDPITRASDSVRLHYFTEGVKYLFEHPLGGNVLHGINFFHNYWLDVGRIAGIIPVILIIILDAILLKHMLMIFKNKNLDEDFRYALFGIYICFFLNFGVEPIMDGYLDLFYRFILINGMVEGIYAQFSRREN